MLLQHYKAICKTAPMRHGYKTRFQCMKMTNDFLQTISIFCNQFALVQIEYLMFVKQITQDLLPLT